VVMTTALVSEPGTWIQFGPHVVWSDSTVTVSMAPVSEARSSIDTGSGVRAMYARLASAYRARPAVPDHGGGVSGDKYPL
jgi:hypothetical protein